MIASVFGMDARILVPAVTGVVGIGFAIVEDRRSRAARFQARLAVALGREPRRDRDAKAAAAGPRGWQGVLEQTAGVVLPYLSSGDRRRLTALLVSAGYRSEKALPRLFGAKLAAFVLGAACGVTLVVRGTYAGSPLIQLLLVIGCAVAFGIVPEFVVRRVQKRRSQEVQGALAEAIDLMIIAANAGQSLDVSLSRVGRELGRAAPALADELLVTTSELQALPNRRDALQNFATRTGVPEVRTMTAALIQTMRYGTPLVQALKILAGELRQAKLMAIEERAARLPALLSLPLMLLIMPAIFIITAGPALLAVGQALFQ